VAEHPARDLLVHDRPIADMRFADEREIRAGVASAWPAAGFVAALLDSLSPL
jgi:hypothetical protein